MGPKCKVCNDDNLHCNFCNKGEMSSPGGASPVRIIEATDEMIDAACAAVHGLYRVDAMRAIEAALQVMVDTTSSSKTICDSCGKPITEDQKDIGHECNLHEWCASREERTERFEWDDSLDEG